MMIVTPASAALGAALAPTLRRLGGAERLGQERRARRKAGRKRAEGLDVIALDADFADQPA